MSSTDQEKLFQIIIALVGTKDFIFIGSSYHQSNAERLVDQAKQILNKFNKEIKQ